MVHRNTILIVDDEEINRYLLCQLFQDNWQTAQMENGRQALEYLKENSREVAIVLLDIVMPEVDGFGVLEGMQRQGLMERIPVVLITGTSSVNDIQRGYEYGVADIINKPFDVSIINKRVSNIIELYRHKNDLEEMVDIQTRKLEQFNNSMIDALSSIVEFRNLESGQHVTRIRTFTRVLLEYVSRDFPETGLTDHLIDIISNASALHDVGKIAIPDSILLKPGRLNEQEYEIMKTHSIRGCEILESMHFIHDQEYYQYSHQICRSHHERWDGRGYPDGLRGDEIPFCAQVVSIADVYDALVSPRVYKTAFTTEEAARMIIGEECGAFNPKLLACFQKAEEKMAAIARKYVALEEKTAGK